MIDPNRVESVSCIVEAQEKILLLLTSPLSEHPLTWKLPSGEISPGESTKQAMFRVLRTQTELKLASSQFEDEFMLLSDCGTSHIYHVFRAKLSFITQVVLSEVTHATWLWIKPDHALRALPLLPSDEADCIKLAYKL